MWTRHFTLGGTTSISCQYTWTNTCANSQNYIILSMWEKHWGYFINVFTSWTRAHWLCSQCYYLAWHQSGTSQGIINWCRPKCLWMQLNRPTSNESNGTTQLSVTHMHVGVVFGLFWSRKRNACGLTNFLKLQLQYNSRVGTKYLTISIFVRWVGSRFFILGFEYSGFFAI